MFAAPLDLSKARILISNDDGINAPGLAILESVARSLSDDVWVVAPETEQSGAGHSLTLYRPLRMRQLDEKRFAVDGTPTDCVVLAMNEVMRERKPDLLLSGVNRGGNLGEDVTYSGTVAAAMEGTLLDLPSIAFSLAINDGEEAIWATPSRYAGDLIRRLVDGPWPYNCLMNVNFPNIAPETVTGVRAAAQGRRALKDNLVRSKDPRGRPYYWIGPARSDSEAEPRTDIQAVRDNAISVTPIFLDLTHQAALAELRELFP